MNGLFSHAAQQAGVQQWQLQSPRREYKAGGIKFVVGYNIFFFFLMVHIFKKNRDFLLTEVNRLVNLLSQNEKF